MYSRDTVRSNVTTVTTVLFCVCDAYFVCEGSLCWKQVFDVLLGKQSKVSVVGTSGACAGEMRRRRNVSENV